MKSVNSINETTGNDSFQRKLLMLKFHVEVEDSRFEFCFVKGDLSIMYTYKYCINVRPLYVCIIGMFGRFSRTFQNVLEGSRVLGTWIHWGRAPETTS